MSLDLPPLAFSRRLKWKPALPRKSRSRLAGANGSACPISESMRSRPRSTPEPGLARCMPTKSSRSAGAAHCGFASSCTRSSEARRVKLHAKRAPLTNARSGTQVEGLSAATSSRRCLSSAKAWSIELALANRDQMGFRMLLGRTALEGRALIEPGRSYLLGACPPRPRRRRALPLRPSKLLR
jgi:hypothetical protein